MDKKKLNLRWKVWEGGGQGEKTKGIVCIHINLSNGHRHQGCEGMRGDGVGWTMGE